MNMKTSMLKPAALFAAMTAVVSLPAAAVETACVAAGGTNCPAQIPDAPQAALVSTMTVPALSCTNGGTPIGVAVRLNITHNWTGDLTVSVANPNAVSATLLTASPLTNDGNDVIATYTGFANMLGTGPGAWTLTVADTANGNDGALNDWGIDAVCSAPRPIPTLSPLPLVGLGLLLAGLGAFGLRRRFIGR
jgi:subtilisin-like proprotein convertase family protein